MGNQLGGMQQATENGVRGMVDQAFAQANAEIEQEVQSYENTVTQRESVLANKRIEINSLRTNINTVNQQCIQIETNNQQQHTKLQLQKEQQIAGHTGIFSWHYSHEGRHNFCRPRFSIRSNPVFDHELCTEKSPMAPAILSRHRLCARFRWTSFVRISQATCRACSCQDEEHGGRLAA